MATASPQIRIARRGTFGSLEGARVTFTDADLQELVDSYDPVSDPAPLVIGHPKLDDEAMGWVERLERAPDGTLVAVPGQIDASFAERVRAGRFRKVSAQFYLPHNPHNPSPGKLRIKHIGFFGAHAVGVKGLGTVSFAEDEAGDVTTIETNKKDAFMNVEDTIVDDAASAAGAGSDDAVELREETVVIEGSAKLDGVAAEAGTGAADAVDAGGDQASFAEREADLGTRETRAAAREADVAAREARVNAAIHDGNVSFAEGQVALGKLAPARKAQVIHLLDVLETATDATASFGEGDAAVSPAALLRNLFEGAAPIVSFGEAAPADGDDEPGGTASFAAPSGYTADPEALKMHNAALRLQSANPGLGYLDAVHQASAA